MRPLDGEAKMRKRRTKASVVTLMTIGAVLFLPSIVGTGHADTCGGALTVNGTNCVSVLGATLVSTPSETQGCTSDGDCVSQKQPGTPDVEQPAPAQTTTKPAPKPRAPVHAAPKPVVEVKPIHAPRSFDDREFFTGTYSKSLPYLPSRMDIGTPRVETNTFTVSPSGSSTLTFDRRTVSSLVVAVMMIGFAISLRKILVAP